MSGPDEEGIWVEGVSKTEIYQSNNFAVRAYVPYGTNWYDYSVRRIKENPKIASYVLKNIFK